MNYLRSFTTAAIVTLASSTVHAGIITFDDLDNGRVVNTQYTGVTISADNMRLGGDYAVAYDSSGASTNNEDSDLEGPGWGNSNIDTTGLELGNVLIIQENYVDRAGTGDEGCSVLEGGLCEHPDDEGRRPAGLLHFKFDMAVENFGLDLIDVELDEADSGYMAWFFDVGGFELGRIDFMDFAAGGSHDQGAKYGDNSVNRIAPIDVRDTLGDVRKITIGLGGSGAVDNIRYNVAEPLTVALFGLGLLGLGFARRSNN